MKKLFLITFFFILINSVNAQQDLTYKVASWYFDHTLKKCIKIDEVFFEKTFNNLQNGIDIFLESNELEIRDKYGINEEYNFIYGVKLTNKIRIIHHLSSTEEVCIFTINYVKEKIGNN